MTEAFQGYREVYGHWPGQFAIHTALSLSDKDPDAIQPAQSEEQAERRRLHQRRSDGAHEVQLASLQIMASTLLHQTPQLRSGERDFWSAFYETRDAHDEMRAAWIQSIKPKRSIRRKPKNKD